MHKKVDFLTERFEEKGRKDTQIERTQEDSACNLRINVESV